MSRQITVTQNIQNNITLLPNEFIDRHMIRADGEYVKIYLMILRMMGNGEEITPDLLADRLELTRKDIVRAISYWENEGVLLTGQADTGRLSQPGPSADLPEESQDSTEAPVPEEVPIKLMLSPLEMEHSTKDSDFEKTIFMAETYLGRPFSSTELNSLCYIRNQLGFSTELLDYLIEYCVDRNKKSMRYIEKVAVQWYQQGICTVKMAREQTRAYTENSFEIMKAFGISGRSPASSELKYIREWDSLGFSKEIILEACNRTMMATHQASFPYANKILMEWSRLKVTSMEDIRALDARHQAMAQSERREKGRESRSNAFHNFDQRSYDYSQLEHRLLQKNAGE